MNIKYFLLVVCCAFLLAGCGENLLAPPGTISFYGGEQGISSSSSLGTGSSKINTQSFDMFSLPSTMGISEQTCVYVKKIEISKTGEKWETVFDGSEEIKVKPGEIVRIGDSVSVPPGQYHGLRLSLEPKNKILEIDPWGGDDNVTMDVTLEKAPYCVIRDEMGSNRAVYAHENVEFTSANGFLNPFDIGGNTETSIVLEMFVVYYGDDSGNPSSWIWVPFIRVRATRFLF
jgi:hypothetical protein